VTSLYRAARVSLIALCAASAAACEAGPSMFDRQRTEQATSQPTPDSVEVSPAAETPAPQTSEPEGIEAAEPEEAVGVTGGAEPGAATEQATAVTASDPVGPSDPERHVRFPHPGQVRGLYVNAWAAGSRNRMAELLEIAERTEVNAFVIDIKDASGYVSHHTELPMASEIGSSEEIRIRDLPGLLDRLEAARIYPIARIVVVKDPVLSAARPELAIQDTAGGTWVDSKGIVWLNPYQEEVWEYHVGLAREVAQLGFPEIQWDYVRFPDAPVSDKERALYPGAADRSQPDAIRAFLEYSGDELSEFVVEVTADVFGVTTSASRDVGIGQVWESFIDVIDVALPMVYPSHYWQGSFGIDSPNAYPYEIVKGALDDAVRRSADIEGAGTTRPWLQDFTLGAPRYGAPEVRAQIQATLDAGLDSWILWNPGSHYTEGALEPTSGFVEEPLVRIANEIVPVSRRFELLGAAEANDSIRGGREPGR
jgi:hypothetical protein